MAYKDTKELWDNFKSLKETAPSMDAETLNTEFQRILNSVDEYYTLQCYRDDTRKKMTEQLERILRIKQNFIDKSGKPTVKGFVISDNMLPTESKETMRVAILDCFIAMRLNERFCSLVDTDQSYFWEYLTLLKQSVARKYEVSEEKARQTIIELWNKVYDDEETAARNAKETAEFLAILNGEKTGTVFAEKEASKN